MKKGGNLEERRQTWRKKKVLTKGGSLGERWKFLWKKEVLTKEGSLVKRRKSWKNGWNLEERRKSRRTSERNEEVLKKGRNLQERMKSGRKKELSKKEWQDSWIKYVVSKKGTSLKKKKDFLQKWGILEERKNCWQQGESWRRKRGNIGERCKTWIKRDINQRKKSWRKEEILQKGGSH